MLRLPPRGWPRRRGAASSPTSSCSGSSAAPRTWLAIDAIQRRRRRLRPEGHRGAEPRGRRCRATSTRGSCWRVSDAGCAATPCSRCGPETASRRRSPCCSGQNLFACYQCGKCTAGCPFSFGPQQVVRLPPARARSRGPGPRHGVELRELHDVRGRLSRRASTPPRIMRAPAEPAARRRRVHGRDWRRPPPPTTATAAGRWLIANNHRLARVGQRARAGEQLAPAAVPGAGLRGPSSRWASTRRSPLPPFARPPSRPGSAATPRPATGTAARSCCSTTPSWTSTSRRRASPPPSCSSGRASGSS